MNKDELILDYEEDIVILKDRIIELERQLAAAKQWPDTWRPITFETLAIEKDEMLIDTGSELRFRSHNGSFDFGILLPNDIRLCRKVTP